MFTHHLFLFFLLIAMDEIIKDIPWGWGVGWGWGFGIGWGWGVLVQQCV